MTDIVEQYVLPYESDHFEDAAYVTAVFSRFGARAIIDAIAAYLPTHWEDPHKVHYTVGFVKDVANLRLLPEVRHQELHDALDASNYFPTLAQGIVCHVSASRRHCIHAIGTLQHRDAGRFLIDALPFYEQYDPLHVDDIVFEALWLDAAETREIVDRFLNHRHFLWRWSVFRWLEVAAAGSDGLSPEQAAHIAWQRNRLQNVLRDESPLVQAEARYLWDLAEVKGLGHTISKQECRQRHRRIKRSAPKFTYFTLQMDFGQRHYLGGKLDYRVEDIEAFIRDDWPLVRK